MLDHGAGMSSVAPPLEAPATRSPGAHRLFVFRCAQLGWIVAYSLLFSGVLSSLGATSFNDAVVAIGVVWMAFGVAEIFLLAGYRREIGGHPAAGLLRASLVLTGVSVAFSAVQLVSTLGGPALLVFPGDLGRVVMTGIYLSLALAFDFTFWLALERLLGPLLEPALRRAFFALRLAAAALSAVPLLPFELYRELTFTGGFARFQSWVRLALLVAWTVPVLAALRRLSARAAVPVTQAWTPEAEASRDLLVGGIWLAGGLLVTLISYGAASGGGGRYVVTFGPILYGVVRVARGLSRRGRT